MPTSSKKIIYWAGRSNWLMDTGLVLQMLKLIQEQGCKIVWGDAARGLLYRVQKIQATLPWLPAPIKKLNIKLARLSYALLHWGYFPFLFNSDRSTLQGRARLMRSAVEKLSKKHEVIIIARSAGARVATLIADTLPVKHIICLGYPFKNPDSADEPERYLHLRTLQTPVLIIQGAKDEYGGIEVKEKYTLSPSIQLLFADTDHNFLLGADDLAMVTEKIKQVIAATA